MRQDAVKAKKVEFSPDSPSSLRAVSQDLADRVQVEFTRYQDMRDDLRKTWRFRRAHLSEQLEN